MRNPPLRSLASGLLCFIFLVVPCAYSQSPSSDSERTWTEVSRIELEHLRPVVIKDLRALISRVENEPNPSQKSVEEEFLRCKFTPLKLGTLGRAILVEGEPGHGATNATMLNIYLPEHGSYRRILEAAGFGPGSTGDATIPDLVFGWASGVCHAKYYRYTFKNRRFETTGCDQESEGVPSSLNDCAIQSCSGESLPTFPNPWPEEPEQAQQVAQQLLVGNSSTGKRILTGSPR